MKTILICAILALANSTAYATINIRGGIPCGEWIKQRGANNSGATELWLVGFLSGMAIASGKDAIRGAHNESMFLWMDNYCKANPLAHTGEGGADLFFDLLKRLR